MGKTPLLGSLLNGLHVNPLPTEVGGRRLCPMAEAPKPRSGASQASASPAPNPGSSIQPALPAQPGRCPGQVCTHSEHNANTSHGGPCYPKNMSRTCWVLRAPVSMRADAGQQAGWLTQRVTEHTPMGAAQGDTGQAGPYLHPPDTESCLGTAQFDQRGHTSEKSLKLTDLVLSQRQKQRCREMKGVVDRPRTQESWPPGWFFALSCLLPKSCVSLGCRGNLSISLRALWGPDVARVSVMRLLGAAPPPSQPGHLVHGRGRERSRHACVRVRGPSASLDTKEGVSQ